MKILMESEILDLPMQFRDYIKSKFNVELHLEQTPQFIVLSLEEDHPLLADIELERTAFFEDPFNPKYAQASWQVSDIQAAELYSQSSIDLPKVKFSNFALKQNKFTILVTALCAIIFILQQMGFERQIMELFHYPAYVGEENEYWRYITHSLVHLSLWHLAFNLTWWWVFAGKLERKFGSFKIIGLFLVGALISGISQNIASGPAFFGLSGVVYAVLGFAFSLHQFGNNEDIELPQGFFTMLIVGILTGFISPLFGVYMGNAAHISGLVCGLILGFVQARFYHKK